VTQDALTVETTKRSQLARWLAAIALALPAVIPYISHVREAHAHGLIPTGFLIHDMPYYMANAQAHFADGYFHLLYQLPFSPYDNTPAIYFQPHTLLLAIALKVTHLPINVVFLIFSAVAATICARVAIALYEHLIGLDTSPKRIGLLIFFWGGGAIVLSGAIKLWLFGAGDQPIEFERYFDFDPFRGFWFLSFGRNLIFGTEAYYHALFFGAVVLAMSRRFAMSAVLALLASLSHPFTGIELLLILFSWAIFEMAILRTRALPKMYLASLAVLLVFHFGYYLWFLKRSPEHADLAEAWAQPFILFWYNMAAAYAFVLPLAIWTVRGVRQLKAYFAEPSHRLLAIWFLVALALANHDLILRPVQPLHFTRGYIWTPLFLMGAPSLVALLEVIRSRLPHLVRELVIASVVAFFVLDNALWLTTLRKRPDVIGDGIMLSPERKQILDQLQADEFHRSLVLSQDVDLGYLVTAYLPLRSWYSHMANTPFKAQRVAQLKDLFTNGNYLDEWRSRKVIVILRKDYTPNVPSWIDKIGAKLVLEDDAFRVYQVNPVSK
jgi:hypothetical protein